MLLPDVIEIKITL